MPIKVLHTINSMTAQSGGTTTCTYDLLTGIYDLHTDVEPSIWVTAPQDSQDRLIGQDEPWIHAVKNDERTRFGWSHNLHQALQQAEADIYHTNGLWRYCNHITAAVARQKQKPFILTPHGMLYPEALAHSKWQKKILSGCWFGQDIASAACVHVTCEAEMEHVRHFGYKGPVALIGNPVRMPEIDLPIAKTGTRFGFLGRLHPRKQVEQLLYADALLSAAEQAQCCIQIMGSGEQEYVDFLHREVNRLGLRNVEFTGFVSGNDKYRRIAELSALIVPSDFENFGMIIAEALLCQTPVLASRGTPWQALNACRCGWWGETSADSIAHVMRQVIGMTADERCQMGQRGQEWVLAHYAVPHISAQMCQLYRWIINQGDKPDFIYEN